jgi:hypothetical protein
MYKLYTIAKKKTNVCGFWRDENGKIFRDKIAIKYFHYKGFSLARKKLFAQGEKAIFYVYGKEAIIESANGKSETLRNCITWNEKRLKASLVKALLVQHNGLTIYKTENGFTIELWKQ